MTPIITGVKLTPSALAVMQEILTRLGVPTIRCSDGPRTPEGQAALMFKHCQERGTSAQRRLYGPIGDSIVDVYEELQGRQEAEIRTAMRDKIIAVGPFKVSHHLCGGPDSPVDVYDFAPSSFDKGKHKAFESALSAHPRITKWIGPPKDLAYHVEILKAVPAVQST